MELKKGGGGAGVLAARRPVSSGPDQLIDGGRALGMDDVRRQLADQATASACQTMAQSWATAPRSPLNQLVDKVVTSVRAALAAQGLGVLTGIDVQATTKTKLDADLPRTASWEPATRRPAYRALQADPSTGLLLPCNVVVRQAGDGTIVEAIDPMTMESISGNAACRPSPAYLRCRVALARVAVVAAQLHVVSDARRQREVPEQLIPADLRKRPQLLVLLPREHLLRHPATSATPEQTRQNVAEVIYLAMPVSTSTQLKCISVGSFSRTPGTPSARTSWLRSAEPTCRLRQPSSGMTSSEAAVRPIPAGDRSGCARRPGRWPSR